MKPAKNCLPKSPIDTRKIFCKRNEDKIKIMRPDELEIVTEEIISKLITIAESPRDSGDKIKRNNDFNETIKTRISVKPSLAEIIPE